MTITIDWESAIVHSDTSIVDMVAFHQDLRDAEATTTGILFPSIHTYKEVQLGGGAVFPAIGFVNGWTLQFPVGNYTIGGGNLDCIINPVAGCYVKQTQSAAYAVSSAMGGSTGPTANEIAEAVKDAISAQLDNITFMAKTVRKKKAVEKAGSEWRVNIYDDDDTTLILSKPVKDHLGNDITDLAAGVLAQELKSLV